MSNLNVTHKMFSITSQILSQFCWLLKLPERIQNGWDIKVWRKHDGQHAPVKRYFSVDRYMDNVIWDGAVCWLVCKCFLYVHISSNTTYVRVFSSSPSNLVAGDWWVVTGDWGGLDSPHQLSQLRRFDIHACCLSHHHSVTTECSIYPSSCYLKNRELLLLGKLTLN